MAGDGKGHYPYQAQIDAYGDHGFRFAEMSHRGGLLCLPTGMHAWNVTKPDQITLETLNPVLELAGDIDVLLIGLGDDIAPFNPEIRHMFSEQNIIVEAVATRSAISTYNVLFSESRAVAAALIAVERPSRVRNG